MSCHDSISQTCLASDLTRCSYPSCGQEISLAFIGWMCRSALNDSYRTDVCLLYPPFLIAIAALNMVRFHLQFCILDVLHFQIDSDASCENIYFLCNRRRTSKTILCWQGIGILEDLPLSHSSLRRRQFSSELVAASDCRQQQPVTLIYCLGLRKGRWNQTRWWPQPSCISSYVIYGHPDSQDSCHQM